MINPALEAFASQPININFSDDLPQDIQFEISGIHFWIDPSKFNFATI